VPYRLGYTPSLMARLGGFEPPAHGLEVHCSILLSYRRLILKCCYGAGEGSRTLATSLEGWGSTTELHPHSKLLLLDVDTFIISWILHGGLSDVYKIQIQDFDSLLIPLSYTRMIFCFTDVNGGGDWI
jgi:hypothetical protein